MASVAKYALAVSLPSIFSDNMVLQQNSEIKIWGWGNTKEPIQITTDWDNQTYKTVADNNANWTLIVNTPKAGGPYSITIEGYTTIKLENVLIGEVWLCGGQSNMEWTPSYGIVDGENEIKNSKNPTIRFFDVVNTTADYPQIDLKGTWEESTPETMKKFSAIGYMFAKYLQEELDSIPIGLISSNWGGTPVETWMPVNKIEDNEFLREGAHKLHEIEWCPHKPAKAYNAMIAPIIDFSLAGILWYQGESNVANYDYYEKMFAEHIKSWREHFGNSLPFYFAQIAPYDYGREYEGVEIRDVQRRVRMKVANTAMVVTSDICTTNDIHPRQKKEVGLRFAQIALKNLYGIDKGIVESPLFSHAEVENNAVALYFENSNGLYMTGKESLFELAGDDNVFYKADATIVDDTVIVSSKKVKKPTQIRFAWGNAVISNVFNETNLPMSSFKATIGN